MAMAQFVKTRRAELGLSLKRLAARCGSTAQHMHEIECGKSCNPTVLTILKMSAGLQVSATKLFRIAAGFEDQP